MFTRIPPQSLESEQSVLGAMMLAREQIPIVRGIIDVDDFYKMSHADIYYSIIRMFDKGDPVDMVTVGGELERISMMEKVGGAAYLAVCMETVPNPRDAETYARAVKEKAQLRGLIDAGNNIASWAYEEANDVQEIGARAERAVMEITRHGVVNVPSISSICHDCSNEILAASQRTENNTGLPTGFKMLDSILDGLQDDEVYVIAARPGIGKTSLALQFADNIAKTGARVYFRSLEMRRNKLLKRILSQRTNISSGPISRGQLQEEQWKSVTDNLSELALSGLIIDDLPGAGIKETVGRVYAEAAKRPVHIFILDYFQLIRCSGKSDLRLQLNDAMLDLVELAKALHIPVVILSQLNRDSVKGGLVRRPALADLKETSGIEESASGVIFIHRPGMVGAKDPEDFTEILIPKNRYGATGMVNARFIDYATKFVEGEFEDDDIDENADPGRKSNGPF